MNGPDAKNQPRVLIVKLSSLGDIFHALPAVHQLKTGLNAAIDWVTQMNYVDLVGHFPDVERVIGFPRKRFPVHAAKFLRTLRAEKYDLIVQDAVYFSPRIDITDKIIKALADDGKLPN